MLVSSTTDISLKAVSVTDIITGWLVAPDSCALHASTAACTELLDEPVIPPRGVCRLALNAVVSVVAAEMSRVDVDVPDGPGKAMAEKVDPEAIAEMSLVRATSMVFCAVITDVSEADSPASLSSTMKHTETELHAASVGVGWCATKIRESRKSR